MKKPYKICMISCLHSLYDDRIYWKEALSLKKNGYEVMHVGVGKQDRQFVSEHGIQMIEVEKKQYFANPFIDIIFRTITLRPSVYKKLFLLSSGLKADVYHFHDLQLNRIGPKLKKLPNKPKVIYDVHEPYPEIIRYLNKARGIKKLLLIIYSKYIEKWQRKCSLNYDIIIATEEIIGSYFIKIVGNENVKVIYNYCDFKPSPVSEHSENIYDLIYIGGISTWRGINEMIETAIFARNMNLKLKILFIGPVKERGLQEKISRTIINEKLEDIFILKKAVERTLLSQYLNASKIGVCIFADNPVYHIIMPIKIFEYMSAGLPVLCNNFGHTYQIIKTEKAGIWVDAPSPENIINSVKGLLQNKTLYDEFSLNARNASEKYSWEIMEKEFLGLYSKLLLA